MLIRPFPDHSRPFSFSIRAMSTRGAGRAPAMPPEVGTGQGLGMHSAGLTAEQRQTFRTQDFMLLFNNLTCFLSVKEDLRVAVL